MKKKYEKMWLHPDKVSEFAYYHMLKGGKSIFKISDSILTSKWAYYYCRDVEDNPEVRKKITTSMWAYYYCINVKDRPEIRKYISGSYLCKYKYNLQPGSKENLDRDFSQTID